MSSSFLSAELWRKYSLGNIVTKNLISKYKHLIKWKQNPSILEIGFADGSASQDCLLPIVPKNYEEYVATDISHPMVDYIKKNVVIPRSEFYQLDISSKDIPAVLQNRFDNVFGLFVLHWVKDNRQAFKNIHKLLKVGGETFQIRAAPSPTDPMFIALSKHPKWSKYKQKEMISQYGEQKNIRKFLEEDLREAGFKNFIFEEEELTHILPNKDSFEGMYLAANPSLAYIPEKKLEEYKECYLNETRKHVTILDNDDGTNSYLIKGTVHIIVAKKI